MILGGTLALGLALGLAFGLAWVDRPRLAFRLAYGLRGGGW